MNTSYEGFSHLLLEAMALEIPIITTNVGGNIEMIDNNVSGILIDHDDKGAIEDNSVKLLNDKNLAFSFVKNSKEKIKLFSEERMLSGTAEILKRA